MQPNVKTLALRVALTYVIVAGCWILFSDELMGIFVANADERVHLSIFKGWVFVVVTGVMLYQMTLRSFNRLEREAKQRREAESAQQDFENRYRQLFEAETDAVVVVDVESAQILDVNPAAELLYGYTREELLRLKATDLSAEPEKTSSAINRNERRIPLRLHRRKNGAIFPVEIYCSEYLQAGRKISVGAMRDITQRQLAQAALAESEQRFRDLFENLNEGFAHCQMIFEDGEPKDFIYLAVNKMFYQISGLKDVVDRRISELIPGIYERDREAFEIYGRVATTGVPEKLERFNQTLQEWLAISVYSTQRGYFVVLMDVITERKHTDEMLKRRLDLQEQLTSITQTVPGVIYSFLLRPDGSTCFPYSSPAIREQFGVDSETLAKDGSFIFRHIHPDDVNRVRANIMESARTLTTWWGEFRFNHPSRGEIWVSGRSEPKALPDGSILWQGFTMESTERKQAEVALKLSDASLKFSSLAKFWITRDSRIVRINPAACAQLGYTEAELLQMTITELDPDFPTARWPEHWQELRDKKHLTFETQHRHKDGHLIPVEVSLNWFEFDGQEYNFAYAKDITERKRAEVQARAFAKLGERLSVSTDPHDAAGAVTATALELFNWDACFLLRYDATSDCITELINQDTLNDQRVSVPIAAGVLHPTPMLRRVIEQGGQMVLRQNAEDEQNDTRRFGDLNRISLSLLYVPLRHQGQVTGFLSVQSYRRNAYTNQDLATLQTLADQCAGSIARVEAEAAMRASEERLRFVTENARVGLVVVNRERRYTFANSTYAEILELPSASIIGQRVADVLVQLYDEQVRPRLDRAFAGERVNYELRKPLRGEDRFYAVTYEPITAGDSVSLVVVVIADITSRRQAEETLRESQSLYHSLITQLPVGIFQKDQQGRYVLVNPEFCRLKKMKAEDFLGKTPSEFFTGEASQLGSLEVAKEHASSGERHHRLIMETGQYLEQDEEHWLPDGEKIFVHAVKFPVLNAAGAVIGTRGVLFNITERKLAEEKIARLATAVEQAAEAITITDPEGLIQYVNPAFEKITGYSSAEAIGKTPRLIKSGQQSAEFYRELWDTLKRGEIWAGHFTNRRKDGSLFKEEATISPIRDAAGKIMNYVAVKRDVTRESQLESQFHQAQKMEAIGTLAGGIAHDFNNILAAMFGYAYLLQQDTEGNPPAQESIEEILKAAGRAKDLVQQILTFSRQRDHKREVIRLDIVVKEVTKFLRASLPAGIKIEINLGDETPTVLADPTQIYQVTMNLATNALHAMEGQTGKLTVSLETFCPDTEFIKVHPETRSAKYARLTISDTGHGMDAKTLERIFEPFFTTKPVGKGTGLGLSVVHGIVQSHDGFMTVDSAVDRGTTFRLYFPGQAGAETSTTASVKNIPFGKGQKILVVDDEPALTAVFCRILSRINYEVTTSNNPRGALKLFSEQPTAFDLIITDLTMPEMNGMELARQIRMIRSEVPILLASGFNAALTPENLRDAGILELIEKPVSAVMLAEATQRAFTENSVSS